MENISSFKIDHTRLLPGLYVSRKDKVGTEIITTFDLRICRPNVDEVMDTDEIHTIEHIAATFLRNNIEYKDKVIYFGPMGCRTGFYFIMAGDYESKDVYQLALDCFKFISQFNDEIPGASAIECGNYLDMNLTLAKARAKAYVEILEYATDRQFVYPE